MTLDAESVLVDLRDGLLTITLNRPEVGNALDRLSRAVIEKSVRAASEDSAVRAVLLAANGKHFCTGADLRADAKSAPEEGRRAGDVMGRLKQVSSFVTAVRDCPKPVVCAVNGAVTGMGLGLALACDVLIASDSAWFGSPFTERGLVPDGLTTYLLTRTIGVHRAKQIFLLGRRLTAEDAVRCGLVAEISRPDELSSHARDLAFTLARGATFAIGLTKGLVNQSLDVDLQTAALAEALAQEAVGSSHDMREGVSAFVERRDPAFLGY